MKIKKNAQGKWEANDGEVTIVADTYEDIVDAALNGSLEVSDEDSLIDIPSERVEVDYNPYISDSLKKISALSGGELFRPQREVPQEWEADSLMMEYIKRNGMEKMVKENLTTRGFESAEEIVEAFSKAADVAISKINELHNEINSLRTELDMLKNPEEYSEYDEDEYSEYDEEDWDGEWDDEDYSPDW